MITSAAHDTLIMHAPIGIAVAGDDGTIESVNPALCALTGHDERALVGTGLGDMLEPGACLDANTVARSVPAPTPDACECLLRTKSGRARRVQLTSAVLASADTHATVAYYFVDLDGRASGLIGDATGDVAEAAMRAAQVDEVAALAEIASALAATLQPVVLYGRILDQVAKVIPYDHAAVMLYKDGMAVVAASRGVHSVPAGTQVYRVADVEDIVAHGAAGKPALIRDTAELDSWIEVSPFTGPTRIRSVLVVPLLIDGAVAGTFNLDSFTPNYYTTRHLAMAIALGGPMSLAVRNARMFRAEQKRAEAAEDLARIRNDFVAAVSHELRTPLTAIVGFSELLRAHWEHLPDSQKLRQLDRIVLSANRQQRLVEDLLLLSQLHDGLPSVQLREAELAPLLHRAADEVSASYAGQRIDVSGPEDCTIYADAERVLQVLINILDNAAKYSPEGSPIAVTVSRHDAMTMVDVRDFGVGVPEEGRDRLFTRFGRVAGSRIRAGHGGTGLGLYLGRQLVRAMNGNLELAETGSSGSTFRLSLPSARPEAHP